LRGLQVERHIQGEALGSGLLLQAQGLIQLSKQQVIHQSATFQHRDKHGWRQHPLVRMQPAAEHFNTTHLTGLQIEFGLIPGLQLLQGQRLAHLVLTGQLHTLLQLVPIRAGTLILAQQWLKDVGVQRFANITQ